MLIKSEEFLKKRLKLHSHHRAYRTNFFKKFGLENFLVAKKIFRPELSPVTLLMCEYLIENKETYTGKEVCDLGCGSGIFSIIIAMNSASKVTAIDISGGAVRNTKKNVKYYNLRNINVEKSNLFQKIGKKSFNIIVTNFPAFLEENVKDYNIFTNREVVNLFFKDCKSHLKRNGKIILPQMYFDNIKTIDYKKEALKNKFNLKEIYEQEMALNNAEIGKTILYEFFI